MVFWIFEFCFEFRVSDFNNYPFDCVSRKQTRTLIYLSILGATFLLLFVRPFLLTKLKSSVVEKTALPIRIVAFPFLELKKMLMYHRTFDEYMRLRREVSALKARVVGFEEVLRENTRLAKLLQFKRKLVYASVPANVIARDPSNWNASLSIDAGREQGLDLGMPVVNAEGVIGKVAEVSGDSAKVILLSDPAFSVVALVQRSREVGLVSGTLQGKCRMRYLTSQADIQVGDQVITSKLSSTFPEGLMIGEVVEIRAAENSQTVDVLIEPSAALSQIEEVLVIQQQ